MHSRFFGECLGRESDNRSTMEDAMDDDAIYAYEQEMLGDDDWEMAHAHEIEAAEEELRALEARERRGDVPKQPPVASLEAPQARDNDPFAATQERVQSMLDRCAAVLGESEDSMMEDTELRVDPVSRKEKATPLDTTTSTFLLSRPPIDTDSVAVVLPTGERRFLRKRVTRSESRRPLPSMASSTSLVPIADMLEAIEKKQIKAAVARGDQRQRLEQHPTSTRVEESTLWLDKYKPQRFVDLLSDEKTNREVLGWIKQWDAFVFPSKKASKSVLEEFDGAPSNGFQGSFKRSKDASTKHVEDPNDPRPREKIILVCGPPGAGKTTLANIVARHAGYNPIEINASDDRTTGVLKSKIINAMEMQSIWGDQKPNCIILDEIDGAMNGGDGKSAIAAIQEIVSAPLATTKDKSGKKTTRRGDKHPLTRPLICICNDQYASVLRPLRKLAKIFVLDTPNSQRLVSRLKTICRDEGIKSSTGALAMLSTNGGNDIRYCVNALQFQSTQTKHITSTVVSSGLMGRKDHSHGVFEVLDTVFYQSAKAKASSALSERIGDEIDEAAHSLGNFPLLISALDENAPRMIFNDPTMSRICNVFEWLGLADSWDLAVRQDQNFAMTSFIPFAARAVYNSCCTSSRRRVEYPKTHATATKKRDKTQNILQAVAENSQLHPSMRNSADVLVVDVVPSLWTILTPNIRHTASNLQSPQEKEMIQRLTQLMAALGLSFRPKFQPDGSEEYPFEPPLHELVDFRLPGQLATSSTRSELPMAVRKMIAREVELENMRLSEPTNTSSLPSRAFTSAVDDTLNTLSKAMTAEAMAKQFILPELTEQEAADKLAAIRKRNPFAFAHREAKRKRSELERSEQQRAQESAAATAYDATATKRPSVRYRYNEGYTSGIKTPVYIRDLM